jgi:hypothetical protein
MNIILHIKIIPKTLVLFINRILAQGLIIYLGVFLIFEANHFWFTYGDRMQTEVSAIK